MKFCHQEEAMKILIISDTHRQHESLKKVLKKEGKIDKLIHLGDVEGYEDYIKELGRMSCRNGSKETMIFFLH